MKHPSHTIIAGNVVTNEMTEELIMHGADVVKARATGCSLAHVDGARQWMRAPEGAMPLLHPFRLALAQVRYAPRESRLVWATRSFLR